MQLTTHQWTLATVLEAETCFDMVKEFIKEGELLCRQLNWPLLTLQAPIDLGDIALVSIGGNWSQVFNDKVLEVHLPVKVVTNYQF